MTEERRRKLLDAISSIEGLTESEWEQLKTVVDKLFWEKEREFKKTLKLSSERVETVIHDIFG